MLCCGVGFSCKEVGKSPALRKTTGRVQTRKGGPMGTSAPTKQPQPIRRTDNIRPCDAETNTTSGGGKPPALHGGHPIKRGGDGNGYPRQSLSLRARRRSEASQEVLCQAFFQESGGSSTMMGRGTKWYIIIQILKIMPRHAQFRGQKTGPASEKEAGPDRPLYGILSP